MNSTFHKRWYAMNEEGGHTFYIEVRENEWHSQFIFESSLPDEMFTGKENFYLMKRLCNPNHTSTARDAVAEKLIQKLMCIPGIEAYYFTSQMLDAKGHFNESYVRVLNSISTDIQLKEFVPYSIHFNYDVFEKFKKGFNYQEIKNENLIVEKECFEELICGHFSLESAYVEAYNYEAEFYYEYRKEVKTTMECYLMVVHTELVLVFFTELQKITSLKL